MRRIILYILVMAAALLIPEQGTDVGELQPVELVFLYKDGTQIVIETDTGDIGRGTTVDGAIRNLKDTTAGVLFLDTADYLLIGETAYDQIEAISTHLKPSVRVCSAEKGLDLVQASQYLAVHRPKMCLIEAELGVKLPVLMLENGRIILS